MICDFKKLGLLLAGTALSVVSLSSVAIADPINWVLGNSATSTAAYLSTHTGVAGPSVITYGINMPIAVCSGGSWCAPDPGPTAIPGGYQGSVDKTWQQVTGVTTQTLTWGTSNGNTDPAQNDTTFNGGGYAFDGTGNFPAVNDGSMLGWTGAYDLTDTGIWDGSMPFIAVNSDSNNDGQTDIVYLVFSSPIAGFSALFNFNPSYTTTGLVYAADASGAQIGSNSASINDSQGGTNGGIVLGFLDTTADIYIIALSDAYSVMGNISITYRQELPPPSEVPEPITLALLGSGLLGLGVARRYRGK